MKRKEICKKSLCFSHISLFSSTLPTFYKKRTEQNMECGIWESGDYRDKVGVGYLWDDGWEKWNGIYLIFNALNLLFSLKIYYLMLLKSVLSIRWHFSNKNLDFNCVI